MKSKNNITFPALENNLELKAEVLPKDSRIIFQIDGKKSIVPLNDFYSFCLSIFTPEQLEKIIIDTMMEVTEYNKQHKVVVSKDLKAGEEVIVNCKVLVPEIIKQKILNDTK